MQEILEMSKEELDTLYIIKKTLEKQITQKKAAECLKLSDRQVRNLITRYKNEGNSGLISKKRGKTSNRSYDSKFRAQILALVGEKYPDFGPTFAKEKLLEYHNLSISDETLRKWMIQANLWVPRKSKRRVHPLRARRECFGELIQIDASFHLWFEDRNEKCALIVFIDDATSKVTALYFCKVESLEGYFKALNDHLMKYGRPLGLYSDRHAIFGGADRIHHAQFIRALKELGIESVLARSPEAKGRVERVNRTLQDRLIKEMRLRNISNMEDANRYLPEFIEKLNEKFSKEPRGQFDTHRPLDSGYDVARILTRCEVRTLSKDLSFSYRTKFYKIMEPKMINRLARKRIEVRQNFNGVIRVFFENKELKYVPLEEYSDEHNILDSKEKLTWKPRGAHHLRANHPWKKRSYNRMLRGKEEELKNML